MFKLVELLSTPTEHPSMTTQQPQEMVTIFTGTVEPSPSTIRALLPTPPILQSEVSLNEGCVVCRTIPNPTNHFTLPLHQFLPLSSHRIRFGPRWWSPWGLILFNCVFYPCNTGFSNPTSGTSISDCEECVAGKFSSAGSGTCSDCLKGKYPTSL